MVTAISFAARPVCGDTHVVRELGTLVLSRAVIGDRRWLAHATAALIPALAHYHIPRTSLDDALRDAAGAVCPAALQPPIARVLAAELARAVPRGRVLELLVEALWCGDWKRSATAAVCAALRTGDHAVLVELPALIPDHALRRRLRQLALRGHDGSVFHADLSERRAEDAFSSSLPLAIALADHVIASRDHARIDDLERVVAQLGAARAQGGVHVARVLLHLGNARSPDPEGERAATIRLRAIGDRGVQAVGGYVLVRAALARGDLAMARRFATAIESELFRQRAELAIARHVFRAGDALRARRALARVRHPALQSEVWRLRLAILMRLRPQGSLMPIWPHGHLDHARSAPAWAGEPPIDAELRARAMLGLVTLICARTGSTPCRATAPVHFRRAVLDGDARREIVETLGDVGLDPFAAIATLRESPSTHARVADPLFAELFAQRAAALIAARAPLPPAFVRGLAGDRPPASPHRTRTPRRPPHDNADAMLVHALLTPSPPVPPQAECAPAAELRHALEDRESLPRALYDEATAYGLARRRPLIAAARAVLREAAEQGVRDDELIASRLRALALLGGELARDAIESALASCTHDPLAGALIEALARFEPRSAGRAALAYAGRHVGAPRDVLALAEVYRGLPRGFAHAWCAAHAVLARTRGDDGATRWLAGLARLHGMPSVELLAWVAQAADDEAGPDAALAAAREQCEALQRVWPVDAARRVAEDPTLLEKLHLIRGVQTTARRAWGAGDWQRLLARAASPRTGIVDHRIVARCARLLRVDERALLAGDLVALGAVQEMSLELEGLRVRLLGKRGDLLAYLRFADVPVANCYRSDSSFYADTQRHTIAVWKDPLSMCFRIERLDGRPFGFVFGGFAELATGPLALVLNGLYLARQRLETRTAVLHAIEDMVCRPLGIRRIGIASQFSGRGPLPPEYRHDTPVGTRLRALRHGRELMTDSWDDVAYDINVPMKLCLYWRDLAETKHARHGAGRVR